MQIDEFSFLFTKSQTSGGLYKDETDLHNLDQTHFRFKHVRETQRKKGGRGENMNQYNPPKQSEYSTFLPFC